MNFSVVDKKWTGLGTTILSSGSRRHFDQRVKLIVVQEREGEDLRKIDKTNYE